MESPLNDRREEAGQTLGDQKASYFTDPNRYPPSSLTQWCLSRRFECYSDVMDVNWNCVCMQEANKSVIRSDLMPQSPNILSIRCCFCRADHADSYRVQNSTVSPESHRPSQTYRRRQTQAQGKAPGQSRTEARVGDRSTIDKEIRKANSPKANLAPVYPNP